MNIVVLDGYAENPGDLSWEELEKLGKLTVYDRTQPHRRGGDHCAHRGRGGGFDQQDPHQPPCLRGLSHGPVRGHAGHRL